MTRTSCSEQHVSQRNFSLPVSFSVALKFLWIRVELSRSVGERSKRVNDGCSILLPFPPALFYLLE